VTTDYRNYLTPEAVSRLGRLDLIARLVVEGYITGLHKSPYHGFSSEFAEHRQYMPGDALRYLDWKVYGRTDRMYVKRFEEETNLAAHLILDVSGSMGFSGDAPMTKLRYGGVVAAALAWLMIRQRDAVGLVTFSNRLGTYLPPRSVQSQLMEILKVIDAVEPAGTTVTGDVLHTLAERVTARGLVILISDLHLDREELLYGIKHFRHNGHEVLLFHVLDPHELSFDFDTDTRFVDMETGRRITTQPWHIRDEYLARQDAQFRALERACHDMSVDYVRLTTDVPFDRALTAFLAKRKRLY